MRFYMIEEDGTVTTTDNKELAESIAENELTVVIDTKMNVIVLSNGQIPDIISETGADAGLSDEEL